MNERRSQDVWQRAPRRGVDVSAINVLQQVLTDVSAWTNFATIADFVDQPRLSTYSSGPATLAWQ
jgi:hypothetical protein